MYNNIFTLCTIISLLTLVDSRPATSSSIKSLDQSTGVLELEAWLLINGSNEPTVKRITPKSIFTVRPHNTENSNLKPQCDEGFRYDAQAGCIRFVQFDEKAHINFLLNKLNMKDFDEYDDEDESEPNNGPLQLNIPFGDNGDSESVSVEDVPLFKNVQNKTLFSLFDEMQNDQPNNTQTIVNNTANDSPDSQTIIILFHPLSSNDTSKFQNSDIDENNTTTTTENESQTTTIENITDKTNTIDNFYPDTTGNDRDAEELNPTNLLLRNGDYKSSFFSKRWNSTNQFHTPLSMSTTTTTTTAKTKSNEQDEKLKFLIDKLSSTAKLETSSSSLSRPESTTQRFNDYYQRNHRNRDRFLLNPIYAANVPSTNARINSKYANLNPGPFFQQYPVATNSMLSSSRTSSSGNFRQSIYSNPFYFNQRHRLWSKR